MDSINKETERAIIISSSLVSRRYERVPIPPINICQKDDKN